MENKKIIDANFKGVSVQLTFDKTYKEWMQKLIAFMKKVGAQQARYLLSPITSGLLERPEYSFFGTSTSVASQFFYFLMKDELSESTENFALDILCKYITTDEEKETIDETEYNQNIEYMINLTRFESNKMLIGQIYDFYISMWSSFEAAINSLTTKYETKIYTKLKKSHFKKFKKFYKSNILKSITDDNTIVEKLEKILEMKEEEINNEFPRYISFPDRTNYLFDELLSDYSRDKNKDKEILLYAASLRNTIHNNGTHLKADRQLEIDGYEFNLKKNNKAYYECYQDIMILINEIFDIYSEIMECITAMRIYKEYGENKNDAKNN